MKAATLEKGILEGFNNANRLYERLSGGEWLNDRGMESFVGSHLAQALSGNRYFGDNCSFYLEMSGGEFRRDCAKGKNPRGARGRSLRIRGRMDLVITKKEENYHYAPLAVVENKVYLTFKSWEDDLKRVSGYVSRYNVPFGVFAAFVTDKNDDGNIAACRKEVLTMSSKRSGVSAWQFNHKPTAWKKFDNDKHRWALAGAIFTPS